MMLFQQLGDSLLCLCSRQHLTDACRCSTHNLILEPAGNCLLKPAWGLTSIEKTLCSNRLNRFSLRVQEVTPR